MYMTLALFRNLIPKVRTTENIPFALEESLDKKKVLIIGHGNIGSQIGSVCEAFGMEVTFFERGDNVLSKSEGADLIINALNCNTSTKNLLNE
jgi:lactate dehydrogenase-like 2-hydroxyacid dehydrogenase